MMHYFVNSAIASSASTPPVIEIGANRAFAAISSLSQHDLVDLGGELGNRGAKDEPPTCDTR